MHRESNILRLVVALILVSLAVACSSTPGDGTAELLVSGDFGQEVLTETEISTGPSLLASLQEVTEVETDYGGGFVAGMFGRTSSRSPRRDWFYFVDGRLAETGARGRPVASGQHIWWDHRRWGGPFDVRAVVGAWPSAFAREGRVVRADPPLAEALEELGGEITSGPTDWQVIVGSDAELRERRTQWRETVDDPGGRGSAATINDGRVRALDDQGTMVDVPDGAAVAVALPGGLSEDDGVLLAIVGLTDEAATAAAETIAADASVLTGSYAVVFDAAGEVLKRAGQP